MLIHDKIIEIFCIADDFCKKFSQEIKKQLILQKSVFAITNVSEEIRFSQVLPKQVKTQWVGFMASKLKLPVCKCLIRFH